jgi:hypothetical protein
MCPTPDAFPLEVSPSGSKPIKQPVTIADATLPAEFVIAAMAVPPVVAPFAFPGTKPVRDNPRTV